MPPKKGGKKGGAKAKTSTEIDTAKTRHDEVIVEEKQSLPSWLVDGFTQKDRDVIIESFTMKTPDDKTELIKNASLRLVQGRRYGLIGANGHGKSTLLNLISTYKLPGFPSHLRVVHVQQEEIPKAEQERVVLEYVLGSDQQKNYLESEEARLLDLLEQGGDEDQETLEDFEEIQLQLDRVYQRLEEIGARSAEARVRAILTGLQFTEEMQNNPIKKLSGGWRMRVRLACALFVTPDILLLDEPTNHLDFPAVEWLASFLRQYEQTLLVVSHDRGFLDQVMTDCIDLRDKTLMYYRGDYTNYLKVRADFIRAHNRLYEKTEKKRQALIKFIAEARQNAHDDPNLADMAKTRQRVLDALPVLEPIREDKAIHFLFPDPGSLDHAIIQCNDMSFHYDPTVDGVNRPYLLNKINAHVDLKSRIGVMGANGAGKTTLINVLLGKYEASEGKVQLNDQARSKVFTQHHLELLDENVSPLQFMLERFPQAKEGQMRAFLGRFGMNKILAEQKIGKLSGGQKSRVSFAFLTYQQPHLIVLDEPTNHLDIETIESLIFAVKEFKGAVIVISHDRYFLSQVAEEFWAVNSTGYMKTFYDLDEAKDFSYQKITYDGPVRKAQKGSGKKKEIADVVNAEDVRLKELAAALDDDDDDEDEAAMLAKLDTKAEAIAQLKKTETAAPVAAPKKEEPAYPVITPYTAPVEKKNKKERTLNRGHDSDEDAGGFSAFAMMDDSEDESEPEYVAPVATKAQAKKTKVKKAKKGDFDDLDEEPAPAKGKATKGKKPAVQDDDMDSAFAALAADIEEEEPATKKKGKKSKKVVEEDDDMDSAFSALAADIEAEEAPLPVKKGKAKKGKKAVEEDDDMDNAFAALAAEVEEAPKKKGKSKKVADDDDMDSAFAALAADIEEEEPSTKKKGKKGKKLAAEDDDMDGAFAALAADLGDMNLEEPVKKKKTKAKKVVEEDDDMDSAFAALAADIDDAPAAKKKGKKGKKPAAEDDDDDMDSAFAALAADIEEEEPVKKKKGKKPAAEDDDEDVAVGKKAARGRNK